ncbi:hypothetical protein B296_00038735 [Ensete ventricosum]|uniref:DUF679 domain-containing protein n=1 Tax=Ensete ventricosum TaxID=4639 RepID=A0A426ZVJ3_ENSVE|nr:hypothetical protein B296_00038735 [Ensete ventricosum]
MTAIQQAISQTYQSTAHLANHLPTGTVLAFQVLSPVFTNLGRCTESSRFMTACLLALCTLSCFLCSFTDSFYDEATRRVRYGVATFRGLWVIDGLQPPVPELAVSHRLGLLDFLHAFTSLLVFAAVALLDKNMVSCYYPMPTDDELQVLAALPVGIGVLGSALLVTFPTTRHGIGFPVTHKQSPSTFDEPSFIVIEESRASEMASIVREDDQEKQQPLLTPRGSSSSAEGQMTSLQKLLGQTYESVANLAKCLPTGTVLVFQVLSPVVTDAGHCIKANQVMTACLVALFGLSCFILSFTDSFRDETTGRVRYGFATIKGLWVIDSLKPPPPEIAAKYRLNLIDFMHASVTLLVFAAVALSDNNVASCFYHIGSENTKKVIEALPAVIGFIASAVCVAFPSTRHGVGFPVSAF